MAELGTNAGLASGLATGIGIGTKAINNATESALAVRKLGIENNRMAIDYERMQSEKVLRAEQTRQLELANKKLAEDEARRNRMISAKEIKPLLDVMPETYKKFTSMYPTKPNPADPNDAMIRYGDWEEFQKKTATDVTFARDIAKISYIDMSRAYDSWKSTYLPLKEQYKKKVESAPPDKKSSIQKSKELLEAEEKLKYYGQQKESLYNMWTETDEGIVKAKEAKNAETLQWYNREKWKEDRKWSSENVEREVKLDRMKKENTALTRKPTQGRMTPEEAAARKEAVQDVTKYDYVHPKTGKIMKMTTKEAETIGASLYKSGGKTKKTTVLPPIPTGD